MKNFMKLFPALLIALLFTLNIAKTQTWTNYTTADGLISGFVSCIAIDNQNNKWFGAWYNDSISMFDGTNWTNYIVGHPCSNIYAIAIDDQNNKWVGSQEGGISVFDGVNWTNYTWSPTEEITFDAQGNVWSGTWNGVYVFDGINWTIYETVDGLVQSVVHSIAIDTEGNKWFGTSIGVSKFDGVNWTNYTTLNSGLPDDYIQSIAIDAQGNKWFGTQYGGLSKFDGFTWTNYSTTSGLASDAVWDIAIDAQNNIWVATNGGVSKFDGTNWTTYSQTGGVNDVAIDANGNKWFGGNGVYELSDGGAVPFIPGCVIQGSIFLDINENGIFDNGETKLLGKMVEVLNDSTYATTQSNGNFYISRDSGTYSIRCVPANYWQFTTDSIITVYVSDTSTYISNIDFGIKIGDAISDVSVDIAGGPTRAGFDAHYWLTYKNEASVTKNGTVVLTIDSLTSFVSSTPPPDAQNGNLITWNYTNLVSLEQRQIQLYLHMPDVSHLGDTLTTTAIINPVPGDMAPLNNYDTLRQVLTGSYDPNDKSVDKGIKEQGYTLFGEELTYTIRFQNTGTDTAFTVQIRDTIDSDLDMASFRVVSSSHNVLADVKNENVVTFIFENILLPDSNVNEAASNGFVKFAIRPKPGLAEYTEVTNKAYIYFDFNPAVVTNQVLNTYVNNPVSGIEAIPVADQSMNLYPNPATNYLTIETTQPSQIEILNLQGQVIQRSNTDEMNKSIDVSDFPAGLYFIKVKTEHNISVKKFVKE